MTEFVTLGDGDLAGDDQDEPVAALADFDQRIAGREVSRLAEPPQALHFLKPEDREPLVASKIENGGRGLGHGVEPRPTGAARPSGTMVFIAVAGGAD